MGLVVHYAVFKIQWARVSFSMQFHACISLSLYPVQQNTTSLP